MRPVQPSCHNFVANGRALVAVIRLETPASSARSNPSAVASIQVGSPSAARSRPRKLAARLPRRIFLRLGDLVAESEEDLEVLDRAREVVVGLQDVLDLVVALGGELVAHLVGVAGRPLMRREYGMNGIDTPAIYSWQRNTRGLRRTGRRD